MNNTKKETAVHTATTSKTHKNAPTSVSSIRTLNDAFRVCKRATDDFKAAADNPKSTAAKIKVLRTKSDAAFKAFDDIRKTLPSVAFDVASGKYYDAHETEDGEREYHVAVTESVMRIVRVRAKSAHQAEKAARTSTSNIGKPKTSVKTENLSLLY